MHNLVDPNRGNSTELIKPEEVTDLLRLKRQRDALAWQLANVERMIEAAENYDPNSEDVF
ncbi:MAG: hypothetical protein CL508_06420 [Actinobacteria bacterium]|jgi:hypothetical protein|nr:hypothetical protein [Actinomycetota bacterium]|tara:strand:- start:210 stop:389 length:180 start_codon:yes stop_codon:yes gene_type:complete